MKKLMLLWMVLCGMLTSTYGQFSQGREVLGGGISYESRNYEDPAFLSYKDKTFNLKLAGGYFVAENLEAGLRLDIGSQSNQREYLNNGNFSMSSSTFSIGPYARLFRPVTDVFALFGEAGFNAGFGGGERNDVAIKIRRFSIGVRPGVSLMVNENLGLETSIGFLGYESEALGAKDDFEDDKTRKGTFQASFNLSNIMFGFRLYLND